MGNLASRQRGGVEELDTHSGTAYRYPPKSGNFFGSHFIMGGEKFDSPQPESFLFGDNSDLNFLGSKPVPFPYPPPQANEPTKTLKSLVNIRRDSLHFVKAKPEVDGGPKLYNVEFTFDCDVRVAISIHYLCQEEAGPGGLVISPRENSQVSPVWQYRRGAGQQFSQPNHTFAPEPLEAELVFSPGSELLPVAIHCRAEEGEEPRQSHLTIALVERQSDGQFSLKAVKQKLYVDGLCYLLQEIYGMENKVVEAGYCGGDEEEVEDTGAECVVCMSDMRDTLILPCRHLCLCNTCADSLRYQANNCPICRAPFRALLQIRALAKSGHSATHPALAAEAHTDGIPPGYELVSLVEALNGPMAAPAASVALASEAGEQEAARTKKKSRRRGSREQQQQRDKERHERRASAPPPVEEPSPTALSLTTKVMSNRKESITIDIDTGETSDQLDLVQEELERSQAAAAELDIEQEVEATTEDELLKEESRTGEDIVPIAQEEEEEEEDEEEECEESESCSVSLRSCKQVQSLPPTPSSARSSQQSQSAESVNSSKQLLGGGAGQQATVRPTTN